MMDDKGKRYGTWYVGGSTDKNHVRLQFDDPVPTDRDIGDIRFTSHGLHYGTTRGQKVYKTI